MTQALPRIYPHSYRVEYPDVETGEWILQPPVVHVMLNITHVDHRFLWFFKWRQEVVNNYYDAIRQARRKAYSMLSQLGGKDCRIVEVLRDTAPSFAGYFTQVVWENGRWLEDID